MRHIVSALLFVQLLLLAACDPANRVGGVPTPEGAVSFSLDESQKKWEAQTIYGSPRKILVEFVPEGDRVENWSEMVANQIVFTPLPMQEYVATWKNSLRQVDPDIALEVVSALEEAVIVSYQSNIARETAIRKFMQGRDGIYMLAYHVRPELADTAVLARWEKIITEALLVENPAR